MRVLFNTWRDLCHPKAGGSEIVVDQLASALSQRGHDVVVRAGGPTTENPAYEVVPGGGTYSQYPRTALEVKRLRSQDVVVDVNNGMSFYSPLLTSTATVGVVHHIHTAQWPMYFGPAVARLGAAQEQSLMPWAYRHSFLVATSPSTQSSLLDLGVHPDRIRRLPLQAEIEPVDVKTEAEPLFIACGRLTPHKRLDLLLEMWSRVHPVVGGRLVLVGDGPERSRLEALAGPDVDFVGRVSETEKAELYSRAWMLLHTAAFEGWGLVITEAGLAGTPAIGFAVQGVHDAIIDQETGLLVNDADDFVASWIALASDRDRRSRYGARAKTYAESLSALDPATVFESVLYEAQELHQHRRAFAGALPAGLPVGGAPSRTSTDAPPVSRSRRSVELSIVIPAYNEEDRLPALLETLIARVDPHTTEILVVDDGSTDQTSVIATKALADMPAARVIVQRKNAGKGAALRAGVGAARGRVVVFMDADGATDLDDLPALTRALETSHVAIGSRTAAGSTVRSGRRHRRLMATTFNSLARRMTAVDVRDTQCGFKAFRGPVARLLFLLSEIDGFAQDVEILDLAARLGFSVAEVPVSWTAIPGSKIQPVRHSARMATDVLRHRLTRVSKAVIVGLTIPAQDVDARVVAKEAATAVRSTDPIIIEDDRVHVLLTGVERVDLDCVIARVGSAVDSELTRWSLDGRSLLRLGQTEVRSVLAGVGEPLT